MLMHTWLVVGYCRPTCRNQLFLCLCSHSVTRHCSNFFVFCFISFLFLVHCHTLLLYALLLYAFLVFSFRFSVLVTYPLCCSFECAKWLSRGVHSILTVLCLLQVWKYPVPSFKPQFRSFFFILAFNIRLQGCKITESLLCSYTRLLVFSAHKRG